MPIYNPNIKYLYIYYETGNPQGLREQLDECPTKQGAGVALK